MPKEKKEQEHQASGENEQVNNSITQIEEDTDELHHLEELLMNGMKSYSTVYQYYLESQGLKIKRDFESSNIKNL